MIKDIKNVKRGKKSYNLEQEIKDQEKELHALKQAFEFNDMNLLNVLPMKNMPKAKKNSARIPKKINDEITEKRKELKKLKEIEELNKIQMTLFKDVKIRGRKNCKLNPISQRMPSADKKFYHTEDYFAINLNKECDKIFGNNNTNNNINNKNKKIHPHRTTVASEWVDGKNRLTNFEKKKNIFKYNNEYSKEMKEINKILNNKENNINDIDEEKDKEFLDKLDNNLKIFYLTKTRKIFELLKSIYLCRYIQHFLTAGYDIFEEFLDLPLDFFDKMKNPFLSQKQREKLFNKISLYKKNKKQNSKNENKKEINVIKNKENKEKIKTVNELGCGTDNIYQKENQKNNIITVDNSSNYPVNNSIINQNEIICCWNCLKPLDKKKSIIKEYSNNSNNLNETENDNILFKYKYFCSETCIDKYENEKKETINNISKTEIEDKNIENQNDDNNNNIINDEKEDDNINNDEEEFYEGDNYDPMEDF